MKTSFFTKSVMTVLASAALMLSACAKKDDSSAVRIADRSAIPAAAQSTNTSVHCADKSANWGKIFDPMNSSQFEGQVKSFVSATLDPEHLGSISGDIAAKTGVDFCGIFQFDSAGNLVVSNSSVIIKVVDSYTYQVINGQTVQSYNVSFSQGSSGTINHTTRQVDVVFKDAYGEIRFQGQFNDPNIVEGTVYYTNSVAVQGYTPAAGKLGTFRAYKASLIR